MSPWSRRCRSPGPEARILAHHPTDDVDLSGLGRIPDHERSLVRFGHPVDGIGHGCDDFVKAPVSTVLLGDSNGVAWLCNHQRMLCLSCRS